MRPTEKKIHTLIQNLSDKTRPELDQKILNDCFAELDTQQSSAPPMRPGIWRILMKNPKLSTAAAASILFLVGLYHLVGPGTNTAFANAMEHFITAQTARFDMTIEFGDQTPQTSSFLYDAKGYIRQNMANGTVNFVDYNRNKVLSLMPDSNIILIRDVNNPDFHTALYDIFSNMQFLIRQAIDIGYGPVQSLGTAKINGRTAYGYCVETTGQSSGLYWQGKGTLTIWADAETDFPFQLQWHHSMTNIIVTVSNIQLNAVFSPEEIFLTIPEGYTIKDETVTQEKSQSSSDKLAIVPKQPLSNEIPDELLEGLNINDQILIRFFYSWSILTKGKFPTSLTADAIKDIDPNATLSFTQEKWSWNISFSANLNFLDDDWKSHIDPNDYTGEEKEQLKGKTGRYYEDMQKALNEKLESIKPYFKDIIKGFETINALPAGSDWHYNGRNAKLGEAESAIFWYKPKDSDICRAIYGDLTIQDVALEDLHLLETLPDTEIDRNAKDVLDAAIQLGADIPKDKRAIVLRMLSLKEEDLIKGLATYLEFSGGTYPPLLNFNETFVKHLDGFLNEAYKRQEIDKKQGEAKAFDIGFAAFFYDKLTREKKDPAYYGDKLTVKDGDKVLVRWKTSKNRYRVVFGNLTRKTVTAEELSELEKLTLE
jgi:outer membrane lipoprotein-sorting protein